MLLAHELKTPITAVKGMVQLAHRRLQTAGHLDEAALLHAADQQINRLTALVNYLLRAGQLTGTTLELHLARFNLADLVREVGVAMQALSTEHTVIVQAPADLVMMGDADRLAQVLRNLINNAIKYSPAGGGVEITLRCVGEEAEVCVRDFGIGIPAADRDQVFDRWHRSSNVGLIPRFGLGLSMSREIVRAHHGRLWVGDLPAITSADATDPGSGPEGAVPGSLLCLVLPLDQGVPLPSRQS